MRSCLTRTLVVLFCAACAQQASTQEKITLQLDLKKGDSRKVSFSMDTDNKITIGDLTVDMKILVGMDMSVLVTDVDAERLHTINFTYDRITMKMTGPLNEDYDSANKKDDEGPTAKAFGALAGQTLTTTMDRQAKVKDVKGFDELAERLGIPMKQLESQREQMSQMVAPLPNKPVGIGDSWEETMNRSSDPNLPTTMDAKYTLTERKDGDAIVRIDGTIKGDKGLNGTISGTMHIEEMTGWTKSGTLEMDVKNNVQDGAEVSMKAKMKFGPLPMQK